MDFYSIIEDSKVLDSKIFSLIRFIILESLEKYSQDGALFRDMQVGLDFTDGALYSNLNALIKMEYIKEESVIVNEKQLSSYRITKLGSIEWKKTKEWLLRFLNCNGGLKHE